MARSQVSCPNCRQPVQVEINQLFDVNIDPSAKNRLLSGAYNLVQCPFCGYQGNIAGPIVYHDPEKELLLTFVPPEMGLPRNEQERLIGGLINQAINKLPQEKRKGYLLKPQETLTMQGLIERVLEADGITREMIQAQQARINLIQRLASAEADARTEIARQEDALIDAEFFALLNRLIEVSLANGDRESGRQLSELQTDLLPVTTYGREIQAQSAEVEKAMADLQALGRDLNRDKLLDLVIGAENDTRLSALISFARPGMDYQFFQLLSERIERAPEGERERLTELRSHLLQMTQDIDRQIEAHRQQIRQLIDAILQQPDLNQAMQQVLPAVDETFIRELQAVLSEARSAGDLERSGKLGQMMEIIEKAATPAEMALIEEYLDAEDDAARQAFLEQHSDRISPEFMEMLAGIVLQVQSGEDKEFAQRVMAANRQALRFSMMRNMSSGG